jgi:osmotically-inducible protein OsmY
LRAEVRDGVATLHGTVRSESERLRAANVARGLTGVQSVLNELVVDATAANDPPLQSDEGALGTAVAAQLRGDPVLGSRDIQVTADRRSNTVTLTGEVGSQAEKERATRIAASAFSAGHVRNRLQVRTDR